MASVYMHKIAKKKPRPIKTKADLRNHPSSDYICYASLSSFFLHLIMLSIYNFANWRIMQKNAYIIILTKHNANKI